MSAAENIISQDAITTFNFLGCPHSVMKAYDSSGQPTWLDSNGELIEGIYIGMENEVYHALPAYSSSQIKLFIKKSPAHFYRKYISDIDRTRTVNHVSQRTLDAGTYGHRYLHKFCLFALSLWIFCLHFN